jgi:hypothetical protein
MSLDLTHTPSTLGASMIGKREQPCCLIAIHALMGNASTNATARGVDNAKADPGHNAGKPANEKKCALGRSKHGGDGASPG